MSNEQSQTGEPRASVAVPPVMDQQPGPEARELVGQRLRALRGKLLRRRAFQEIALLAVGVTAVLLGAGAIDYVLRFPEAIRVMFLLAGLCAVGFVVARRVIPAFRFRPSLTSLALRVEAKSPGVQGRLASAVEFESQPAEATGGHALERALSRQVVRHVAEDFERVAVGRLVRRDITVRRALELVLAVGAISAIVATTPTMAGIGARRLLLPWSGAEWPKRTEVMDLTGQRVHPLGESIAMRALLTRSERGAERTEVSIQYRSIVDGEPQAMRREILALQRGEMALAAGAPVATGEGQLFERLIEPEGESIEFRFLTEDDATAWCTVRFVEAPAIRSAQATVAPPAYAQVLQGDVPVEPIDMGSGADERAVAPPALQGAAVVMSLELNKPADLPEMLEQLIAADAGATLERIDEGRRYEARFTLHADFRLRIDAIDEHEIRSPEPAVYIFSALADKPPAATIVKPTSDLEVLATAVVDVQAEARDDVALAFLAIQRQVFVPAGDEPSGPGGALEAQAEPLEVVRVQSKAQRTEQLQFALDLGQLTLVPGDEVHVTALASDMLMSWSGAPAAASSVRTLRIISEQDLVDSIRGELAELRQAAIRVDGQQAEQQTRREAGALLPELRRGQGQVSERLVRQGENLSAIRDRVAQNRLQDPALDELLSAVDQAIEDASGASARAERQLEGAQQAATAGGRDPEVATEEESEAVGAEQRQVREALARVAEMLDRGEDAWVIQNTLNRLLRDQQALRDSTAQAGAATAGQRAEDMVPEARREMQRLAEAQRQLADLAEQATQELRDRAEALRQSDPSTAAGLQQAAASAQEQRVAQTMREAAEAAEQNQTASAGQSQDKAIEAIEEMIEQLEQGERKREQALRRVLSSVIESIEQLITQQEDALTALDAGGEDASKLIGLDRGMIALNQNTLGVADVLRAEGQQLASVLNLVSRAGDAQVAAIRTLRAGKVDVAATRGHEQQSLDLLREAMARAKAMEDQLAQQEQDRKERELKAAYTALLRQATRLGEVTAEFAIAEQLTRRDRAQLRELAGEHDDMVARLDAIAIEVEEIEQAHVFAHAHARAKQLAERGGTQLRDGDAKGALKSERDLAQVLRNIVESLSDPQADEEPFTDGQSPGGGGGGGGQGGPQELLPAPKELRLLRFLQIDLAARTVDADGLLGEDRQAIVRDVAEEQGKLSALGRGVVERLQGGGGGGAPQIPNIKPGDGEDVPAPEAVDEEAPEAQPEEAGEVPG